MKKQIIIAALLAILSISSYSQIVFENGYFINESDQKINCLIKNIDWESNPVEFEYKVSQDDLIQKANIQSVKEFCITGVSKYIRAKVNIDRSTDDPNKIGSDRNPVFQEETLFLKVIVEGKASLFLYREGSLTRFFYRNNDSEIIQLVYKRYILHYALATNNYFRQQLFEAFSDQIVTLTEVESIRYVRKDLEPLFIRLNGYANSDYIVLEPKQKRDLFNLSLRAGLNFNSLSSVQSSTSDEWDTDFGNKLNPGFGIEAEFIFPFNKNKWSVIVEPTYQYFNVKKSREAAISGGILVSKVNYQSIELPVGVRHYFYLNDKSKIFMNVSYVFDFSKNSSIEFTRGDGSPLEKLDINPRRSLALGIGFKFQDKYGIELRYETGRELLGDYLTWNSVYKTLSFKFGYTLF
jgi:hypothetical protein